MKKEGTRPRGKRTAKLNEPSQKFGPGGCDPVSDGPEGVDIEGLDAGNVGDSCVADVDDACIADVDDVCLAEPEWLAGPDAELAGVQHASREVPDDGIPVAPDEVVEPVLFRPRLHLIE